MVHNSIIHQFTSSLTIIEYLKHIIWI
jgi:hypothetical protein